MLRLIRKRKVTQRDGKRALRDAQELFKDKRHLKENRTTNNQEETEVTRLKNGEEDDLFINLCFKKIKTLSKPVSHEDGVGLEANTVGQRKGLGKCTAQGRGGLGHN